MKKDTPFYLAMLPLLGMITFSFFSFLNLTEKYPFSDWHVIASLVSLIGWLGFAAIAFYKKRKQKLK